MQPAAQHTFPGAHALQLVTLVARWGITAEALLAELGRTEEDLEAPDARLSVDELREVSERARKLTGEPGIGFYLGLQKRAAMYGHLGFATMSAATVRESLQLSIKYAPTVTTGLTLSLREQGDTATLVFEEHVDLGSAHDIATFSLLVGMRQLSADLLGRKVPATPGRGSVDIPFAKPEYFDRFAHLLPTARFDQEVLRVHFPASSLDKPLVAPNRAALRLAREACERELQALGFDRTLPARVRALVRNAQRFPSVEDIARDVHMSTRTLKRKLAATGETLSDIVDIERRERALQLLRTTDLTLEEIAERLDYSTLPNFSRAFRRWTGDTPAAYRKRR